MSEEVSTDDVEEKADSIDEEAPGPALVSHARHELQQAQQLEQQITQIKQWSIETATELRTRAQVLHEEGRVTDEELQQIEEMASQIQSLYGSIA